MRRLRLHNLILIFLSLGLRSFAQHDPMYSLYMYDKMLINPAFTGSSNWAVGTLKYRNQFTGFSGNPKTQTLNFHTPVQIKHIGLGFKVINDKLAIVSTQNITADFSYHLNFLKGKLSFGIEAGFLSKKTDAQKVIVSTLGDNSLTDLSKKSTSPDVSWGLFYQKKEFYVGLSQYHIVNVNRGIGKSDYNKAGFTSNYYFTTGKVFDLSKNLAFEPSILIKLEKGVKAQTDLNAVLTFNNLASLGIQYRTDKSFNINAKFNITQNLKIAYSFDYSLNKIANYPAGSHELLISYGIKLPPPPTRKEIHPRYYF